MRTGQSTKVYKKHLSNLHPTASCGERCTIHSHVWIGADVTIGNDCKIQAFSFIPTGVAIGNRVFIGPRVTFTNDKHPPSHGRDWSETIVGDNVVIGAGAVILPGVLIGDEAVIGAGAVVTRNVIAGTTVIGNPARVLDVSKK